MTPVKGAAFQPRTMVSSSFCVPENLAGVMASGLLYGCSNSAQTAQTSAASQTESSSESRPESTLPPETGKETQNAPSAEALAYYDVEDLDVSWNPDEVTGIVFEGEQITIEGDGAETSGSVVTVRSAGTYVLSGNLADGQVIVDAGADDVVRLVLNGVELSNSQSSPIYGVQSKKIILTVEPGTENKISDSAQYNYEDPEQDEPDAAIFSHNALVFNGIGNLSVSGNYACGIRSKSDLTVISGNLTITSQSDALKGKDSVAVLDGNIRITSGKELSLQDESGEVLVSFVPVRGFNTVIASVPTLEEGKQYSIVAGEMSTTLEISGIETSSGTPRGRGDNGFGSQRGEPGENGGGPRGGGRPSTRTEDTPATAD